MQEHPFGGVFWGANVFLADQVVVGVVVVVVVVAPNVVFFFSGRPFLNPVALSEFLKGRRGGNAATTRPCPLSPPSQPLAPPKPLEQFSLGNKEKG